MADKDIPVSGRAVPAGPAGFAPNPQAVSVLPDASLSRDVQRCINVLRGNLLAGGGAEARAQRDADIAILETLL